jgi:aryl-alcohol dehydrogenase-like predicted oxidoreductase
VRHRPLGNTGIEVSELALGTWGLSGDGYGPVDDAEADRTIDRALERGVDLFDTADVYGKGAMERRLGARLPADRTYVVTKLGTDVVSYPARKRFDLEHLRPAFERSRERLKRERLDVVLLHNPTMQAMARSEAFDFLKELKRLGALRAWGVSAGSADVARAATSQDADVIELPYNLFFSSDLHEIAGAVSGKGTAVLARSVLAHGMLTGTWSDDRHFPMGDHRRERWNLADLRRRLAQVDALRPMTTAPARAVDAARDAPPSAAPIATLRAAAVRYVLANQLVTSAVLGPRSVAQLDELVDDAGEGPPYLRDTLLAEVGARLRGAGIQT